MEEIVQVQDDMFPELPHAVADDWTPEFLQGQAKQMRTVLDNLGDYAYDPSESLYASVYRMQCALEYAYWTIGDLIERACQVLGKMAAYREAASAMGKSIRWSIELAKVARTFPPELRYVGVDWHVYRTCANTADPEGMLKKVLEADGSITAKDIRAMAKEGASNGT